MAKTHRQTSGREEAPDQQEDIGRSMHAMGRQAKQKQALDDLRHQMKEKATHGFKETVMTALLIFRQMISTEAHEDASKKLELGVAEMIGEKFVDKIKEHFISALRAGLGLSKVLTGVLTGAFSKAQSIIKGQIAARKELTAIELADDVSNGMFIAMDDYVGAAAEAIDGLNYSELLEIRRTIGLAQGAADEDDDELKGGIANDVLERLVGLPQTGGAPTHEIAKLCYMEYRARIRASKPVREQVDEIKNINKLPEETEQKAKGAEEKMSKEDGSGLAEGIKRDQYVRGRVENET